MQRPFSLKFTLLSALALGACLAASCSENGATSLCPALPRYQTSSFADGSVPDADVAGAGSIAAELARAVDAGCYTAPTLFPSEAGSGGAASNDDGTGVSGSNAGASGAEH